MRSHVLQVVLWAVLPVTVIVIAVTTRAFLLPNFIPAIVALVLAYLLLALSQFATRGADRGMLGLPIVGTTAILFLVSVAFNAAMVWVVVPLWTLIVVVNVVLVAVLLLLIIPMMLSNDRSQQVADHLTAHAVAQSDLRAEIRRLRLEAREPKLAKLIDRLEEDVRYAPTVSTAASAPYDQSIRAGLAQLSRLLASGDDSAAAAVVEQVSATLKERTNALKAGR